VSGLTGPVELVAPAKLNLTLRVLGTRPDGFHELDALTVPVDEPHDVLVVRAAGPGRADLTVDGGDPAVPAGPDNLVVRAARAVLPADIGLAIRLTKSIPAGGGLGGGSADAGALLRLARDRLGVASATVTAAAAGLGSDVPACVEGRPVRLRGRGERIDPVELAGDLHVVIATPGFGIRTPDVFRAWDELGGPAGVATPAPPAVAHLVDALVNDLEPAAEHVEPRSGAFRQALGVVTGTDAHLAGSGSSCWVACSDAAEAAVRAGRVRDELGTRAFVGRVLSRVPG
jgi:4-diphosphocytidyl-2-C-methyl-D-erythritol kinase